MLPETEDPARFTQVKLLSLPNPLMERLGADWFRALPTRPGVYSFYGAEDRLLYIGQSGNLKERIGSYRQVGAGSHPRRLQRMVARIVRAEWVICESAAAAIRLESAWLLEKRPPFNRAGVWRGDPWWLGLRCGEHGMEAMLSRHPEVKADAHAVSDWQMLGPLPASFRYQFASLARCACRAANPELSLTDYPFGFFGPTIPPHVRIPSPSILVRILAEEMTGFVERSSDAFLLRLETTLQSPGLSPAGLEYWTEECEQLRKAYQKPPFAIAPASGTMLRPPAASSPALPLFSEWS